MGVALAEVPPALSERGEEHLDEPLGYGDCGRFRGLVVLASVVPVVLVPVAPSVVPALPEPEPGSMSTVVFITPELEPPLLELVEPLVSSSQSNIFSPGATHPGVSTQANTSATGRIAFHRSSARERAHKAGSAPRNDPCRRT